MTEKNIMQKMCSILIVLILGSAIPLISPSKALSEWEQSSIEDFKNGTFIHLTIGGNLSEVELECAIGEHEWINKSPENEPLPRWGHSLTTIWGTDKVLLFSGAYGFSGNQRINDTWLYNSSNNSWTEMKPNTSPSSRYGHTHASIWGNDQIVIYNGGYGKIETWIYDLSDNNWTENSPVSAPTTRAGESMTSVWGTKKVVLFGGHTQLFEDLNDTWIYDVNNDSWDEVIPKSKPQARTRYSMASIFGTDKVIIFGGRQFQGSVYNDTWIYDLSDNNWTKIDIKKSPPARYDGVMASIWGTNKVVLFGGRVLGKYNEDTWIFDLKNNSWTKVWSSDNPDGRSSHEVASIWGEQKALLFGGERNLVLFNDTWIYDADNNSKFINGTYISEPYDTLTNSTFRSIGWMGNTSVNTSIKFQFRTSPDKSGLETMTFIGPDGTANTNYTNLLSTIWPGHGIDRWMQYKMYLETINPLESPRLKNVSIVYNNLPDTLLYSPVNESLTNINTPLFSWNFTDRDSNFQSTFQLLIDKKRSFDNIDYDSGAQKSSNETWQFPNGTTYTVIPDGTWYWKVRSMDDDGDWGYYTQPWKIIIDATAPASVTDVPENNGAYNKLNDISGTASDPAKGSGLSKVEISITRLNDTFYWDGAAWSAGEKWLLTSGTADWNYDTSSVVWSTGTRYTVRPRAVDIATNVEIPGAGNTFIIDFDSPNSIIDIPVNDTYLNKLNKITGRAFDTGMSRVKQVEINIMRSHDLRHWDGATWVSSPAWLTAEGTADWFYDSSNVIWDSDTRYIVRSRAIDNATNIEVPGAGNIFYIDLDLPSSTIDFPTNNSFYNRLDMITGTARDSGGSGIEEIKISIKRTSDKKYWNGTTWTLIRNWLLVDGTSVWSYNSSKVIWTSNTEYIVRSRAKDHATNIEIPTYGKRFLIDLDLPTSTIDFPLNNSYLNGLDLISGTAQDSGGSGIAEIKICIKRTNDQKYWDGISWSLTESWLLANGTKEWSYNSIKVIWTSNTEYIVRSRARDYATNIEIPSYGTRFSIDLDIPSSTIEFPVDNTFLKILKIIFGKAVDTGGSGVYEIQLSLKRISDDNYWNGNSWSPDKSWFTGTGTESWSYDTKRIQWTTDTEYKIRSRAIDNAGNIEVPDPGITFTCDNKPPEPVSISINDGDVYTNTVKVVLSLHAEDSCSGVDQMAFSTDIITWSAWEKFEASRTFVLPEKDGTKHVYFKVKDRADNIAKYVFDNIILDTTPPDKVSILINENAVYTNTTHVNLNLNAVDSLSGINNMSFSDDGIKWNAWEPYQLIKSTTLSTGDGEKIVYFRVNDNAGNIAFVYDTIILDTEPPHSLIIYINKDEPETNSPSVNLKLSAADDTSGVYQMSFNTDGDSWSEWEDYADTKSLILQSDDGEKIVYFKVKDRAGNIAEHVDDSIIMVSIQNPDSEEPPTIGYLESNLIFILFLIIILIMISLFIVAYYHRTKKRKQQEELAGQKKTEFSGTSLPGTSSVQSATLRPILTPNAGITTIQPLPASIKVITPVSIPAPVSTAAVPIPAVPETPQLPPAQDMPKPYSPAPEADVQSEAVPSTDQPAQESAETKALFDLEIAGVTKPVSKEVAERYYKENKRTITNA
jgi:hypothetical protein